MEQTKKNKGWYIALSIVIAIGLWMYVVNVDNPERDTTLRGIPISFVGREVLESRGLMISEGADQTVTLSISGRRDALSKLSGETVNATVDVAGIERTGEYTLSYQVAFNLPGVLGANPPVVTNRSPQNVNFTVSKLAVRYVPVKGTITGSVADGYQAEAFSFSPAMVEIRGEESVVNQIEFAQVSVSQEEMSDVYSGELPFTFVSYEGEAVQRDAVETDVSLIRTTLPIVQLKEVELAVNVVPGGGATEENIRYEISPPTIMVAGAADDLEGVETIYLGTIDLSKVLSSGVIRFPINLAPELTNVSGMSEASVDITISGLVTRTLEVDNISFIHPPEGYTPRKVTQSRQVQIRGTSEAVAAVAPAQLRIVADLSKAVAATGTQTIPVKVYLNGGEDVGVVGDYNIVISITK